MTTGELQGDMASGLDKLRVMRVRDAGGLERRNSRSFSRHALEAWSLDASEPRA